MPKREAVRDNLDAPLIGDGHVEVHVGEADVASADLPLPAALGGHVTIKSSDHSQGSRGAANTAKDCFNTRPSAGSRRQVQPLTSSERPKASGIKPNGTVREARLREHTAESLHNLPLPTTLSSEWPYKKSDNPE